VSKKEREVEHKEARCPSCNSRVPDGFIVDAGVILDCLDCGARMEVQKGSIFQMKLLAHPSRPAKYERLGPISDIPSDSSKVFRVGNRDIAVFRTNQQFFALKNQCPHHGLELSGGKVESGLVRCSGHGFRFDLQSGKCDRDPDLRASTYDLKIEGDELFIRVS
jgi:nitrite reductase (NADH) small subunit